MRTAFETEGDIRGTDLLAGLVTLWRQSANGTLHFSRSGATTGFALLEGEIVSVRSSDPRFETASILVRAGKLDAETLERLSVPKGSDRALAALQSGILTKREWRWGEKIRAVEVLSDLLTWIEGDYVFDPHARPEAEAGEFRLTVPRLVLELFLRSRDRGLVLHYLGGADVPLARADHFEAEFPTFGLTADAESVVQLIDGKSTAAEIASEAPAEAFAVEKLLAALVTLGLVHPEFVAGEARAAVPAAERGEDEPETSFPEETEPETGRAREAADEEFGEGSADAERAPDALDEEFPVDDSELVGGASWPEESAVTDIPLDARGSEEESRASSDLETAKPLPGDMMDLGLGPEPESPLERPLDVPTEVSMDERPRPRSSAALLWLFALLALAVAAVLYFRSRGSAPPGRIAAVAGTPTVSTVPAATTAEPAAAPAERTAAPSPVPATRAVPTRPAAAPRTAGPAPARRVTAAPSRGAAREDSRSHWLDRAASDRKRADSDRKARFAIQLELACQIGSLVDAWKYDRPAGTMWVLATPFRGATCFRVLWGRYPTQEAARRALADIPPFFATRSNRPVVVAIR